MNSITGIEITVEKKGDFDDYSPDYKCGTCEQIVSGFHDCKKITGTIVKDCGCKIITKRGFKDVYSVFIEDFEHLVPCFEHSKKMCKKAFQKARKNQVKK